MELYRNSWRRGPWQWCLFRSCFGSTSPRTGSNFIIAVFLYVFRHFRYVFVQTTPYHYPGTISVAKQGVDADLNSVTALAVTDCDLQYWTDLRVPTDPSFYMDDWSSRGNVYSRHAPSKFASTASPKYCPRSTVFMKPASQHNLINRRSSGRFANFRLCSRSKSHRACSLVRSGRQIFGCNHGL